MPQSSLASWGRERRRLSRRRRIARHAMTGRAAVDRTANARLAALAVPRARVSAARTGPQQMSAGTDDTVTAVSRAPSASPGPEKNRDTGGGVRTDHAATAQRATA